MPCGPPSSSRQPGPGPDQGNERWPRRRSIPQQFLEQILLELKRAGLVKTKRGARGGYWLAVPSERDHPRRCDPRGRGAAGQHPRPLARRDRTTAGAAARLSEVWIAIRAALRAVLEEVTLAELVRGELPDPVARMIDEPDAWIVRDTGAHDIIER